MCNILILTLHIAFPAMSKYFSIGDPLNEPITNRQNIIASMMVKPMCCGLQNMVYLQTSTFTLSLIFCY